MHFGKITVILKPYYEKIKQQSNIWIWLGLLLIAILLFWFLSWYPHYEVSKFGITNPKDLADTENSYRATLAQILGGIAIGITLYYTHKRVSATEKSVSIAQEGQITDRFTRAIEQLGNEKKEVRFGGIYALERVSNESEKDRLPIIKILAAYIREKSQSNEELNKDNELPTDIQAVLEIVSNPEHSDKKLKIDLQNSNLKNAQLYRAHLSGANLKGANLENSVLLVAKLDGAYLDEANLASAFMMYCKLKSAKLLGANLESANLQQADLERANLAKANLKNTNLMGANLRYANFRYADITNADLRRADLRYAAYLSADQLSKVKSLFETKLDEELSNILKDKTPHLFEKHVNEQERKERYERFALLGGVQTGEDTFDFKIQ